MQTFTDTIAVLLFFSPLWFPLLLAIIFNKQLKQYAYNREVKRVQREMEMGELDAQIIREARRRRYGS
ncbi:hypothetical protein [Rhodococcus erythropolis]|uniref:hypothetical protein n=1 Tax=Rhodococcus erythropolis TaxID=1833 RepID=UPI00406BBB22